MYSYLPLSDLSVKISDLYMNIDLLVNMSFLSVNISDLSEHITVAHEHIRPVCEHIRLVCEHINWHINLQLTYKLAHPSTHACIVTMFAFYVCRIVCIYYLINLFGDHQRNVSINFEYLSINKNTSA